MGIASTLRRVGLTVGGTLGAAAICVACGSSTSGSPASTGGGGGISVGNPSASVPSVGGSISVPTSASIPSASAPSLSIGGDGSDTAFCKDLKNIDPSSVGSDPSQALKLYDQLAEDAPSEIKPDVEKIRDFLKSVSSGGGMGNFSGKDFQNALSNLGKYAAAHCVG